jgi:hypothetical protein
MPRTLFEKIWDVHVVRDLGGGCVDPSRLLRLTG